MTDNLRARPSYAKVTDALRELVTASAQAVGLRAMPIDVYLAARRVLDDVDQADARPAVDTDKGFDDFLSELGVTRSTER